MYNGNMAIFKRAVVVTKPDHYYDRLALILILLYSIAYWLTIPTVPYHPDEATQIFMSADWEALWSNPTSLVWQPNQPETLTMHYRLVDPPLTHWFIGAVRSVFQLSALEDDWDWSLSWDENIAAGALPSDNLLVVSRSACAWCIPLTLWAVYKSGKKLQGIRSGYAALVLMMLNALVLLHTRRAMAESLLLCFSMLSIWCMLSCRDKPWLIAIPAALAFNAKYSAAGLVLLGFLLCFFPVSEKSFKSKLLHACLYASLFLFLFFVLNPVYWQQPIPAFLASIQERNALSFDQVSELSAVIPHLAPSSIILRGAIDLMNVFLTPPAAMDVGNYAYNLLGQITAYFSNPLNSFSQKLVPAAITILLLLLGSLGLLRQLTIGISEKKWNVLIVLVASILNFLVIVLLLPLTFQRYIIPLVPFSVLFSAAGFAFLWDIFQGLPVGSHLKNSINRLENRIKRL
jgi:4-amino-4-deoxy-L-arabinose transferase-like glycosyltransferase